MRQFDDHFHVLDDHFQFQSLPKLLAHTWAQPCPTMHIATMYYVRSARDQWSGTNLQKYTALVTVS